MSTTTSTALTARPTITHATSTRAAVDSAARWDETLTAGSTPPAATATTTTNTTANTTSRPTATSLTRLQIVQRMSAALADHRWALQGARDAVRTWIHDDTLADLEVWAAAESTPAVDNVLRALGGVLVSATSDQHRPMHRRYWLPTAHTCGVGAIVEVTVGDLRVGPALLAPAMLVQTHIADVPCGPYAGVRVPVLAGIARRRECVQ